MERREAVIIAADLVGYTRLMEHDEVGTWSLLKNLREKVVDPTLTIHGGRVFKTTGDGMLAEFSAADKAVKACIELQTSILTRMNDVPVASRMQFRVGIASGEVIVDGDDLFGDAVNVAARLEGICQPGAICVSAIVYKASQVRAEAMFEDIGEVVLRNRTEPVRSYVWRNGGTAAQGTGWHTRAQHRDAAAAAPRDLSATKPGFSLPSIAVLPFDNFSSDEELGHFAAGIAEDITTELYRFCSFSVIARTSAFMYERRKTSARQAGEELGAGYVLEGSIRKLGSRVRIAAQLIDVAKNDNIWAERFDIEISEIFEAQDHIVARIVATLGNGIERHQLKKARHLDESELEAYGLLLRGLDLHKQGYASYEQAVRIYNLFSDAVAKDPNLGRARAWKACAASRLWPAEAESSAYVPYLDEAVTEVQLALESDENDPEAHRIMGAILLMRRDYERARFHIDRAMEINPNNSHVLAKSGNFYSYYGDPSKALELLEMATHLNPHHPDWYWQEFGLAAWAAGDYAAAIGHLQKSAVLTDFDHVYLAASHAALGNNGAAAENLVHYRRINESLTTHAFADLQPFRLDEVRERLNGQLADDAAA